MTPGRDAFAAAFLAASGRVVRLADRAALAAWLAAEVRRTGARAWHADPWLPAVELPPGVERIAPGAERSARPAEPLLCALTVDAALGDRPVPGVAERYPGRRRMMHLADRLALVLPGGPPLAPGPFSSGPSEAGSSARPSPLAPRPFPDTDLTFVAGPSRTADIEKVIVLGAHGPAEATLVLLDGDAAGEL